MLRAERTDYEAYVAARAAALRRTAFLLCGDWPQAEDLAQTALTRLYVAWWRASRADNLDAYARRVLVRCWIDELRRRRGREAITNDLPEPREPAPSPADRVGLRESLLDALRRMPEGQRACVVLRFWEDLSIQQTAALLHVSEGTVKSQTTRGLRALRALLGEPSATHPEGVPDD